MSLSLDVLANIKTHESEDEEDVAMGATMLEDILGIDTNATETYDNEQVEDPLQETTESTHKQVEMWEYTEEEFYVNDNVAIGTGLNQAKRARLNAEYKGRNGHLWSTVKSDDVPMLNIAQQPKGKGPARQVSNPLEAWSLLFDEPILAKIVKHTNEEIRARKTKEPHQRATDLIELRAWLGLNYLCGLFRNATHNGPLVELWTIELGHAIFRATMSVKRFEFLMECLRFHEYAKKIETPLESVRQVWDKFLINCRSYYAPSGNCTIDEHIITITDNLCPYQQYLTGNTDEIGLRLVTLCDAKTLYMCNAIIATEVTPACKDILQLVSDLKGTNRNICLSDRYTTLQLANKLLQSKLSLTGAICAADKIIPSDFLHVSTTQTLYAGTATLICNSNGYLLTNGISQQLDACKLYALTAEAAQRSQALASIYSTNAAMPTMQQHWTLEFFHAMLNSAGLNAWILYRLSNNGDAIVSQRDFLRQLGLYLTQQQLKRRLQRNDKLSLMQKLQISEILGEPMDKLLSEAKSAATTAVSSGTIPTEKLKLPEGITLLPKFCEKRARCRKCPSKSSPKTRMRCQQCLRILCNRHLIQRCDDCTGIQVPPQVSSTENELNPN